MAQDYIKINGVKIWQPDCDIAVALETTYTQGSTRAQSGKGKFTPMFTVERFHIQLRIFQCQKLQKSCKW